MGKINAFYGKYLTDFFPVRHFPRDGQRQISFLFSRSWLKGSLSSTFLIENQNNFVAMRTLKNHLDKTKSLPFVKRIADFHLLLFLAMFHGLGSDVLTLAACVSTETTVPEGYQLLIESMANTF
ncbi:hypothetical protein ERO13_A04G054626v2 [Gossypium hirsutum]|nr:hypothetical protein ERO13_A04G054626v2 [Gossypium hirsutum]